MWYFVSALNEAIYRKQKTISMKEGKVTSCLAKVEVVVYSVVVEVVVVVIQYTRNLPLLPPFSLSSSSFPTLRSTLPSPLSLCTQLILRKLKKKNEKWN